MTEEAVQMHRLNTPINQRDPGSYVVRILLQELRSYYSAPISGVYLLPNKDDVLQWDGLMVCREGLYSGGFFCFTITFPVEYPSTTFTVHFKTRVFHPLVDTDDGRFNFLGCESFRNWNPDTFHVFDLCRHMKEAFADVSIVDDNFVANKASFSLFQDDRPSFSSIARTTSDESKDQMYDVDSLFAFKMIPQKDVSKLRRVLRRGCNPDSTLQVQDTLTTLFNTFK
ncbi:hypothetical protein PCE1_004353 [Barthelona sp. PCE]